MAIGLASGDRRGCGVPAKGIRGGRSEISAADQKDVVPMAAAVLVAPAVDRRLVLVRILDLRDRRNLPANARPGRTNVGYSLGKRNRSDCQSPPVNNGL
jgi:hypothetical protein